MPKGYRKDGTPFFEKGNIPWNKSFKWVDRNHYQKEYLKKYHKTYLGSKWWQLKSRADLRGHIFSLKKDELRQWLKEQKPICSYCDMKFKHVRRLTIDRKINNLGYVIDNIILACDKCNRIKMDIFTDTEMRQIAQEFKLKDRYMNNKLKKRWQEV